LCTFFGSDGREFTIKFNYLQLLIFWINSDPFAFKSFCSWPYL
jgi:hypothetical protein